MIALIDYGAGNLTSVKKALTHVGSQFVVPTTPADLDTCTGIIIPGVGNFEATAALGGTWTATIAERVEQGVPLLGICLGLQWLFDGSDESPGVPGLGLTTGRITLIEDHREHKDGRLKVPHVGWNSLDIRRPSWILQDIRDGDQVYFTHSFAAPVTPDCVASTTYGVKFASVVERGQVAGVQFHPEKSGEVGLAILRNFLRRVDDAGRGA